LPLEYQAERILIRCPNWVGDAVMATPAIRCIRRNYPRAEITLLARPYVRDVYDSMPWFDQIVELRDQGRSRSVYSFLKTGFLLRRRKLDLAILLTHSFSSALLARAAGASERVGYTRGDSSFLLTDAIPWPRDADGRRIPVPKVELYMNICAHIGCEGMDDTRQELFYSDADYTAASAALKAAGADLSKPMVGLVPGAAFGSSKYWDSSAFARVADFLCERHDCNVVIIASPAERDIAEEIVLLARQPVLRLADPGLSLRSVKPLVAMCSLLVTTDTGPRHFGVAFDVPTVVLMGSTDPRNTDSDYEKTVIIRKKVPCGPCHLRKCPTDHQCMKLITPDEVVQAAEKLLGRYGTRSPILG